MQNSTSWRVGRIFSFVLTPNETVFTAGHNISAGDRHDLPVAAGSRDLNQAGSAEPAMGRVEGDPSGAGKIDFRPGMGRTELSETASGKLWRPELSGWRRWARRILIL